MSNTNGTEVSGREIESILDVLLIPPTTENGVAKSLFVEAREKAIQTSARTLKNWHKACFRDAVIIMAAEGSHEAAEKAAIDYLKLVLGR